MSIESIFGAVLPSLIVGVVMAVFNSRQKKRDTEQDEITNARARESLLHLNLQMATAKLSYATAMAIKRGKANGEVEEGIDAYKAAKDAYTKFLNEQATDHLNH